jgi:hypothetical protein
MRAPASTELLYRKRDLRERQLCLRSQRRRLDRLRTPLRERMTRPVPLTCIRELYLRLSGQPNAQVA